MKKKQIIGLVVAAALVVGVSAASGFTNTISKNLLQNSADDIINLGGSYQFNPPSEDYIAIVRVEGTIQEQSGSSMSIMDLRAREKLQQCLVQQVQAGII